MVTDPITGSGQMMYQDEAKILGKRDHDKVKAGEAAWRKLKDRALFPEWLEIGEAIEVGRRFATKKTGQTKGGGRGTGYNATFNGWLDAHGFDEIHKTTRTALHNIMTWKKQVVRWLKDRAASERGDRLNHPVNVWKAFEKDPVVARLINEDKEAKRLMKDGMSEDEARTQAAAMPENEKIEHRPQTRLEQALAELDVARRNEADAERRAVTLAEDNKALRAKHGEPELPDEPLVPGVVTVLQVLNLIINAVPRNWSLDEWDRLHELLREHIDRLREGGIVGQLAGTSDKPGPDRPRRRRKDLPNDDIPI